MITRGILTYITAFNRLTDESIYDKMNNKKDIIDELKKIRFYKTCVVLKD